MQGSLRVTDTVYTTDLIISDTTAPTIANTDYLLLADASGGNKILKGPVFDGSTATKALTQKGTWETFNNYSHPTGDGNLHVPATSTTNNGKFLKAGSSAGSLSWATAVTSITIKTTSPITGGSDTATTTTGTYTIAHAGGDGNLHVPATGTSNNNKFLKAGSTAGSLSWSTLATTDIPTISITDKTSGTLTIARGGTNATSITKYAIVYGNASANGYTCTQGSANTVLTGGGDSAAPSWTSITDANTANTIVKRDSNKAFNATLKETYGTSSLYGTTLPTGTITAGRIFFQISDPFYELPAGGTTGQALIKHSNSNRDVEWGSVGGIMRPDEISKFYLTGSSLTTENTDPALFSIGVYVENAKLFGTMWNDYAEFRETKEQIEPGRCIVENGDGTLSLSTARLQGGAEIVSDTYGLAIGKSDICNTPIAVSGRVLAYIEDRTNIKIGAPVCSGPNGTVSQMTEEEARLYPWLIIGTISAIPQEETWGEGKVEVKNRIWVRVR